MLYDKIYINNNNMYPIVNLHKFTYVMDGKTNVCLQI